MAFDREARPARPARGNKRRKVCQFCAEKCECIDYKDTAKLRRFISERSKILPRRTTCTCAIPHHREKLYGTVQQPLFLLKHDKKATKENLRGFFSRLIRFSCF